MLTDLDLLNIVAMQIKSQLLVEEAKYKIYFDLSRAHNKYAAVHMVATAEAIAELKRQNEAILLALKNKPLIPGML